MAEGKEVYRQPHAITSQGKLAIIAGPHGSGKDTLANLLPFTLPNYRKVVRYTTRPQGLAEVQGIDYHFVGTSTFTEMAQSGEFIEFNSYMDGATGTRRQDIRTASMQGSVGGLTINFEDGLKLKEKLEAEGIQSVCFFIGPCTEEEMIVNPSAYLKLLSERMERRGRSSDNLSERLKRALEYRNLYLKNAASIEYIPNINHLQHAAAQGIASVLSVPESTDHIS